MPRTKTNKKKKKNNEKKTPPVHSKQTRRDKLLQAIQEALTSKK